MSDWTSERMESERVVRYADLVPCLNAFIDTRNPGSEAKENFTIIGPGVSENPAQHVHIAEPHGFNIGGARQPPGCVNSQHSHDTAEVFIVHSGRWRFTLGEKGENASVDCGPGDVISLPTAMFRGFTCLPRYTGDEEPGYLFAVLGGDDPGRVLWAPYVFDMARNFGLTLLANGDLIDTRAGQTVPHNAELMPSTTAAQVKALHVPSTAEAEAFVVRHDAGAGTYAEALIGEAGPLDWLHGFALDRLVIDVGEMLSPSPPQTPEVLFVQSGMLDITWQRGTLTLGQGDVMTVPLGLDRTLSSTGGCVAFMVTGE